MAVPAPAETAPTFNLRVISTRPNFHASTSFKDGYRLFYFDKYTQALSRGLTIPSSYWVPPAT